MEPEIQRHRQRPARQACKGKTRIDVVDEYAYPVPVTVICKILGVPLEDEPRFHGWIEAALAGLDLGPEASDRGGAAPRSDGSQRRSQEFEQYLAGLIEGYAQAARPGHALDDGATTTARTDACRPASSSAMRSCCSSPVMIPRST